MKEDEVLFLGPLAVQKSPKLSDQEGEHHILNLNVGLLHLDAAQKLLGHLGKIVGIPFPYLDPLNNTEMINYY